MNPSSNPQPRISDEQYQLIDRLLTAHKGLSSGQVEAIIPVIQQYAKAYASELIGENRTCEKNHAERFDWCSYCWHTWAENDLRDQLHQLNNERAGKL